MPPMPASGPDEACPGIDYKRLHEYRFRDASRSDRQAVWNVITPMLYDLLSRPRRVLDPAGGFGGFINAIPATARWIVDLVDFVEEHDPSVEVVIGDIREVELPQGYFDGVFVSNLLEQMATHEEVGAVLRRLRAAMTPGGRVGVLGPNFKCCADEYFDCANHVVALTHLSVEEHLYATGFEIEHVIPKFLASSFRGRLPPSPTLTLFFLGCRPASRILGKRFYVVGRNPGP